MCLLHNLWLISYHNNAHIVMQRKSVAISQNQNSKPVLIRFRWTSIPKRNLQHLCLAAVTATIHINQFNQQSWAWHELTKYLLVNRVNVTPKIQPIQSRRKQKISWGWAGPNSAVAGLSWFKIGLIVELFVKVELNSIHYFWVHSTHLRPN